MLLISRNGEYISFKYVMFSVVVIKINMLNDTWEIFIVKH